MSENAIIFWIVLAVVAVIAAVFIRHARRHRETVMQAAAPEEISVEVHPIDQPAEDVYMLRHIYLQREPFKGTLTVRVRPEYVDWIRKITATIGESHVPISDYVDKVLKAHFDDNREVINALYRKKSGGLFKTDG